SISFYILNMSIKHSYKLFHYTTLFRSSEGGGDRVVRTGSEAGTAGAGAAGYTGGGSGECSPGSGGAVDGVADAAPSVVVSPPEEPCCVPRPCRRWWPAGRRPATRRIPCGRAAARV